MSEDVTVRAAVEDDLPQVMKWWVEHFEVEFDLQTLRIMLHYANGGAFSAVTASGELVGGLKSLGKCNDESESVQALGK